MSHLSKRCPICEVSKPITDFYNQRGKIGGSSYCKQCSNERRKEHRRNKPELVRKANLRACYGISTEEYTSMYDAQSGRCAICEVESDKLFVDHCHSSMKVRGLLCHHCNSVLGYAHDSIDILKSAQEYLRGYEQSAF